ncbi:protein LEAD-SENSITIVE 1-like [Nicotiana tabacum]|uniref:Protein LEAD-SENSITIVE 1-like n=1 Tax=Nicotiana tabacum TaxID=4097 RepID=A0AC58SLQ1_TOBAC
MKKRALFNKIKKEELKAGDHIYTWRLGYLYAHHGIYVDAGKVIHFTSTAGREIGTGTDADCFIFSSFSSLRSKSQCPTCGDRPRNNGVISSCLECFLSGGKLRCFKYGVSTGVFLAQVRGTCTTAPSDQPEDVLHRAELLLSNGFGDYHLFKNNCEDFAIYCKTGYVILGKPVGCSGQVGGVVASVAALSCVCAYSFMCPSLAPIGLGTYCISRYLSDIGVRKEAEKIAVEKIVSSDDLIPL